MKNLIKKTQTLARALQTFLLSCLSALMLYVSISWPESLVPLPQLLSQDKLARESQPEIEAAFQGVLAGEKKMYSEAIRLRMPFHFLPSCSSFRVELGLYDWLLCLFGHKVRSPGTTKIRNWRNGKANKFIFHMFKKLAWLRDQGDMEAYWKLAWTLMNSHAYQVCAYNYVRHNWHTGHASLHGLSLSQVVKELDKVKSLVAQKASEIKFKRVYIPKSDDPADERKRPLGVPSPEWRVYLHMYNNLIVWARTGQEGSQHAYFPQRGVITAWRDVFKKISAPNIMEFDLKGFFDAVNLEKLHETIWKTMKLMPMAESSFVRKLNRSIPKIGTIGVMEEPDLAVHLTADLNPNPNPNPARLPIPTNEELLGCPVRPKGMVSYDSPESSWARIDSEFLGQAGHLAFERAELEEKLSTAHSPDSAPLDVTMADMSSDDLDSWFNDFMASATDQIPSAELGPESNILATQVLPQQSTLYSPVADGPIAILPGAENIWKEVGVPQGAPTSCSVSTIALHEMHVVREKEFSGYADDGLWFNPSHPESLEQSCETLTKFTQGVPVNVGKSQMLKKDGKWLVESFKYLGLRYFPEAPGFVGSYGSIFSSKETLNKALGTADLDPLLVREHFVLGFFMLSAIGLWIFELPDSYALFGFAKLLIISVLIGLLATAFIKDAPRLPTRERMVAATRKGATLEFGIREQFLAWLLVQREKWIRDWDGSSKKRWYAPDTYPKFEGSAARLNHWIPSSARTWIFWEYMQFVKSMVGPKILVRGKFSGYFLSRLYLDTWNYSVPQDFTLNPTKWSWVSLWWIKYRMKNRGDLNLSQLAHIADLGSSVRLISLQIETITAKAAPLLRKVWAIDKLIKQPYKSLNHARIAIGSLASPTLGGLLTSIWGPAKFPDDKLPTLATRAGILSLLEGESMSGGLLLSGSSDPTDNSSSSRLVRKRPWDLMTRREQKIYNILKEMSKKSIYFRNQSFWLLNLGQVQLNIFNASSFAVDSMLRDYPWPKSRVRYYDPADKRNRELLNAKKLSGNAGKWVVDLLKKAGYTKESKMLKANLLAGNSVLCLLYDPRFILTVWNRVKALMPSQINYLKTTFEKINFVNLFLSSFKKFVFVTLFSYYYLIELLSRLLVILRKFSKAFRTLWTRIKEDFYRFTTLLGAIVLSELWTSVGVGSSSLWAEAYAEEWMKVPDTFVQLAQGLKPESSSFGYLNIIMFWLVTTIIVFSVGFPHEAVDLTSIVWVPDDQCISGFVLALPAPPVEVLEELRSPIFAHGFWE